jgi:hypothetical protein
VRGPRTYPPGRQVVIPRPQDLIRRNLLDPSALASSRGGTGHDHLRRRPDHRSTHDGRLPTLRVPCCSQWWRDASAPGRRPLHRDHAPCATDRSAARSRASAASSRRSARPCSTSCVPVTGPTSLLTPAPPRHWFTPADGSTADARSFPLQRVVPGGRRHDTPWRHRRRCGGCLGRVDMARRLESCI